MPVTLGMYEKGLEHIGERLAALGLDLKIVTFNKQGKFLVDGARVVPGDMALDYLWLNSSLTAEGFQEGAFELALAAKSIGVMQTYNAGLDHPFYRKLAAKGTRICNSSAQAVAISEFVMAHVLSLNHPIELQREQQARRQWKVTPYREISQTSWLIVGFGAIGSEIARRVKPFGARVTMVRRAPAASPLIDACGTMADLPRLLPEADVIVLACALNGETRGMADERFFAAVKKGAILVNIARGPLIDDQAMIAALDDGRLAAAVLDVFHEEPLPAANPLWAHPKVRLTPHTSFAGSGVRSRWDRLFLNNIGRFVRGEPLINEVNPKDLA
jgi:phosphoglycerate dehydrogenase-like enzyme